MLNQLKSLLIVLAATAALIGGASMFDSCGPLVNETVVEQVVQASIDTLFVADSARFNNIRATIRGVWGKTTAYRFGAVVYSRNRYEFNIAVWAVDHEESKLTYEQKDIKFDTTMIFQVPADSLGKYYFKVYGSNGIFTDSTIAY
jgi:hypothetical protein